MLASHAAARRLPIASTTKLMTAYVALQELPLKKIVRAAPYEPIYGESLLDLRPGQRISVRDLLYGLVLRSGNDAAYDLALAAAGSERRFVRQMNRRAAALGLADTHYANPIGLDQHGNYSSAVDLAALTRRLLRKPVFAQIADSRSALLRSLRPPRRIATLNDLLLRVPWATGVKTGHTFDAAYVLVGSGRRKGVELISAVLGAPTETDRDARDPAAARLRLLPVPQAGAGPRRGGARRAVDPLPGRRAAAAGGARGRGRRPARAAAARRGAGAARGRGADPARRRAGQAIVRVDGLRSAARAAARGSRDSRGERLRPGAKLRRRQSGVVDRTRALFAILVGAWLLSAGAGAEHVAK